MNSYNSTHATSGYASYQSGPLDIQPFPNLLDSTFDFPLGYDSSWVATDYTPTHAPFDPSNGRVLPSWPLYDPVPSYSAQPMPGFSLADLPTSTQVYQDSADHMLPSIGGFLFAESEEDMYYPPDNVPTDCVFPSQMYTHDPAYDMRDWAFPPALASHSSHETSSPASPASVYECPHTPSNSLEITPPIECSFPVQASSPHAEQDIRSIHSSWAPESVGCFSSAQLDHVFASVTPPRRIRKAPARESIKSVRRRNELLNKALLLHKRDMRILKESLANVNDLIIDIRRKLRV
jgi:hypothetical protein